MLDDLRRLARNLWWCWDAEATRLFEELSPSSWEDTRHNAAAVVERLSPAELEAAGSDPAYRDRVNATLRRLDSYLADSADHGAITAARTTAMEGYVNMSIKWDMCICVRCVNQIGYVYMCYICVRRNCI